MAQRIGPKGLALVKSFEGCILYPYDDLVPSRKGVYPEWKGGPLKGTPTIGIGHTNAAKHPLKVVPGLRITEKQALDILAVDMSECQEDVRRLVKVPLTQGQFDALCSFCFNCGPGALKNIAARLNRGEYANARAALGLYTKSMGRELAGLVRRRKAEQALWDDRYTALPDKSVDHPADVDDESFPPPPDIEPVDVAVDASKARRQTAGIAGIFLILSAFVAAISGALKTAWEWATSLFF